jgi:hypothetical protein
MKKEMLQIMTDIEYACLSPLDEIRLARNLVYMNHALVEKYPNLEDALRLITSVIDSETNDEKSEKAVGGV